MTLLMIALDLVMINLFVVESPLQLLSAIEAAYKYKGTENIAIVKYGRHVRAENNKHMEMALSIYEFDSIYYVRTVESRFLMKLRMGLMYAFIYSKRRLIERIFIGDYRSVWMHRCIEISRANAAHLLDDGIITIHVYEEYLKKGKFNKLAFFARDGLSYKLFDAAFRLLGSDRKSTYELSIFTSFVITPGSDNIEVVINDYSYLSGLAVCTGVGGIFYFGTKYSEAGYFSLEVEVAFLITAFSFLKKKHPTEELLYIPHRDDSKEKLERIKALGVRVFSLGMPAEMFFLKHHRRPRVVAGAYSTAIANVRSLYKPEQVYAFRLPMHEVEGTRVQHVSQIYAFYDRIGIPVIDLDLRGSRIE